MSSPPPVLLTVGQFYGTLAAARCLGRAGVPVTLGEGHLLAPARWSRYVTRRVPSPDAGDTDAFLAWLLAFGEASPGHVLLPTSDDVAWLVAENREALARRFHLLPTPFAAVDTLLDKRALLGHCEAVGLAAPETWFPQSEAEAVAIGAGVGLPLLIKPRTQVQFESHGKGALVEEPAALGPRFRDFVAHNRYGARVRQRSPDVVWPMLQRFYPGARHDIYGLSGYAAKDGELLGLRAARKILQRPRKLGIGLCFEEADIDDHLAAGLSRLCRRVGYQGVFEVEFVEERERAVLIDFNPRFYSQMAFDIDRGAPLPRLAYADALGDSAALTALAAEARRESAPRGRVYCHHFQLEVMLRAQRLSGRLSAEDARGLRRWWAEHRGRATHASSDAGDPLPWVADVTGQLGAIARHPRSFIRAMVLDR